MTAYVIMGVSGSGKSHIGAAFANTIGGTFIDGDDLHSATNIAKMAAGTPLNDDDRTPWLDQIADRLSDANVVIGCSALKRIYRDRLQSRAKEPVVFLYLYGDRDVLLSRMSNRPGHFMPASLLDSQLATLEPPTDDENVIRADIAQTPEQIVADLVRGTTV